MENENKVVFSEWRQRQIGTDFNNQPGLDDLKKIKKKLKDGMADHDIMKFFGINCDTLSAIKKDRYCPAEGINLDNMSKIYIEFDRLESRVMRLTQGLNYIASILLIDKTEINNYKKACRLAPKKKNHEHRHDELSLDGLYDENPLESIY